MTPPTPVDATERLLVLDGNSLMHRSYHAHASTDLRTRDGQATWAIRGFLNALLDLVARVQPTHLVVGFDDPQNNARKHRWPEYKATRPAKPADLAQQLTLCVEVLRAAGVHVVMPPGYEADDVLASAAAEAARLGWTTVLTTSDRDAFALVDEHTSVLRLINGGVDNSPLLTVDRVPHVCEGVPAVRYRSFAALRGDSSDNLSGVPGVGPKTAAKLLAHFDDAAAAFADAAAGGVEVTAAVGARYVAAFASEDNLAAYNRNMAVMSMRTDLMEAPQSSIHNGRLPLVESSVRQALAQLELDRLGGPLVRALCPAPAPQERPAAETSHPMPQDPHAAFGEEPRRPASVSVPVQAARPAADYRPSYAPALPPVPSAWSDTLF